MLSYKQAGSGKIFISCPPTPSLLSSIRAAENLNSVSRVHGGHEPTQPVTCSTGTGEGHPHLL